MRLVLFGAPTIERDAGAIALPFERRSQLVALLALKRSWVGRVEIATMLWPGQSQNLAYTNLRKTLFRLSSVPWTPPVEAQGGSLRIDVATDVADFDAALRAKRIADALALRRGELLAGFDDDGNDAWSAWLAYQREQLRSQWRDAALARLGEEIEASEDVALAARLLDADPLDEAALRAYMSCLARAGQAARARQAYRDFTSRLAGDLGLVPTAALASLHDSLATPLAARAPVAKVAAASADGFVGRTVELRRIATLLAGECRLLTLVGPGGAGKTRLARRALDDLAAAFPGGAVFVPLEDVALAKELGGRIARELGVRLAGGKQPLAQVIDALAPRAACLVLDNFEQLAADAAVLEGLLAGCPQLRIVVTSRVRLALAAEWLLPVDGLPCPEDEDRDRVESFDAARLFVQAAHRVEPALVPALEAASIVEICRAVEGLPLALELAASWTRVLSCDAIAVELRKGSALLHTSDRSQPARHASFDAVFGHSWRILGARERDALARLSVFRGGFAPDAARAVAATALPVLGALTDKSLLRKDAARLFMHPLVAQSAAAKLDAQSMRESTERAHANHFDALLAQLRRGVEDGDRDALQRVELELENCKAAWRFVIAHGAADAVARLARVLLYFWDHRGRLEEGLAWLREAQSSTVAQGDAKLDALLLACASHLEYRLDRYAEAVATAARAMARAPRDKATKLQALKVRAACSLRLGRHADAKRFYHQALLQAPEASDPHNAAALLDNLALVEKELGNYDEALALSLRSLAAHRRLRDAADEALCLNNLGALYFDRGEYESAGAHLREALALCERHGLVSTRGLALANLTEYALRADDLDAADDFASRALDVARTSGNRSIESWLLLQLVRLALRRADATTARAHLAASLELAAAVRSPLLQVAGIGCFADIAAAEGAVESAHQLLRFAQAHASSNAALRADLGAQIAKLGGAAAVVPPWPGIEFDELVHRIVVEAPLAHAPLLAALRSRR